MRITSWNILHGQPITPISDGNSGGLEPAIAALKSDLIALQEVDYGLERSGRAPQSAEIATYANSQWWGFAPTIVGTPGFKWRKLSKCEQQIITTADSSIESYGIAIVSAIEVTHWLRHELGRSLVGMPLAVGNDAGRIRLIYVKDEPRVAMAAVLANGWTVINTHLSFVPLVNIYQLFKVIRWAKAIEKQYATKVLIAGDLNLPWGIPSRITRWNRVTKALSYPSWKPAISFDYILAKSRDSESISEVLQPQQEISDHKPITVEVR
jgi:endonuclease/exonuclease/phosphatase family metal-dependent hydrolase